MNFIRKFLFITFGLLHISLATRSQKKFQANIQFPSGFNTSKIKIFYINGKETKKNYADFQNNQITISDSLYSIYATLFITYYETKERSSFARSFFIGENAATLIFNENNDTLTGPLANCKMYNAFDIAETKESKQMGFFTAVEKSDYDNFLKKFGNKIYENDSLNEIRKLKYKSILDKEIDFIRQDGSSYYSLWVFENEIIPGMDFLSADSLLKIYYLTFSDMLKNSFAGTQVETMLRGRANVEINNYVPYFKSIDINNKVVDLKDFKGKYVLINFWASWCGPCIAEFETIKKLNNEYGKSKLAIISISIDQDKEKFLQAVKKYQLNWINIYHDIQIENIFLKNKGVIPQVYLLDTNGKLMYSRKEDKDDDLHKLVEILKN